MRFDFQQSSSGFDAIKANSPDERSLAFQKNISLESFSTTQKESPRPLCDALTASTLESLWNQRIDDFPLVSDEEVVSARLFIGNVRDRIVEGLEGIEDPIEFQSAALLAFTRLKAFWFELNTRLGHHLSEGDMNYVFPLRASLVATILEAMEPFLSSRSLEKVNAFLSAVMANEVHAEFMPEGNALLPGPKAVREKIAELFSTISDLSERVVHQESELIQLRTGQESLKKAFGEDVDASEMASRVRILSANVTAFEAQFQMEDIYRNVLGQALGTADPLEVVKEVRRLRDRAREYEQESLRLQSENERVLARFGTNMSADSALDQMRDAENSVKTLQNEVKELQSVLAEYKDGITEVSTERDYLLQLIGADSMKEAEGKIRTLHENAAAYADIASLLGDMGNELNKISG